MIITTFNNYIWTDLTPYFIVKIICHLNIYILQFNPLTLMSDQDRISLYNIKQTSDENTEKY